jgi:hypothetical protein
MLGVDSRLHALALQVKRLARKHHQPPHNPSSRLYVLLLVSFYLKFQVGKSYTISLPTAGTRKKDGESVTDVSYLLSKRHWPIIDHVLNDDDGCTVAWHALLHHTSMGSSSGACLARPSLMLVISCLAWTTMDTCRLLLPRIRRWLKIRLDGDYAASMGVRPRTRCSYRLPTRVCGGAAIFGAASWR